MKKYFQIAALILGLMCAEGSGLEICEMYHCAGKVGVGIQGGAHNAKTLESASALASLHIETNIWRQWFYFGLRGQFGLGQAWLKNRGQDSATRATYDDIGVRFALGVPINAAFSHTPSIALSEPVFLYLLLGVGNNDYAYKVNLPSQERNVIGLGIAGIHRLSDEWNLEYALEYGYIYNAIYEFSTRTLGTRERVKAGSSSHELRLSLGLTQRKEYGFYTRLSGIYRALDSTPALPNTLPAYPRSTQAVGMLEVGFAL